MATSFGGSETGAGEGAGGESEEWNPSQYNAYWGSQESGEGGEPSGFGVSPRTVVRGARAVRSPEAMTHFLSHEAIKELAPELAPIIAPILMPLITVAFAEWEKYQQYLQNQAQERQQQKQMRDVYRSVVPE